jgi:ribose 5-phosphate isomerase B
MKLVIGSDHAGFELKTALASFLKGFGHEILDAGTYKVRASESGYLESKKEKSA